MNIDGKKISSTILSALKEEVAEFPHQPKLIDVVVGADPVTESYVRIKSKRASEIGIDFQIAKYPQTISEEELCAEVEKLNKTPGLCGLIVQMPIPESMDKHKVLDKIDPRLDVDVMTSTNLGKLFTGKQYFAPATASAILQILDHEKVNLEGMNVLVVGSGDLVGKPVSFLLMQKQATVTVANASTKNLSELCRSADVIISGTGVPGLIKGDMVKKGVVVVDAGTAESSGGIGGDVDYEAVAPLASLITPVPGGVGPVTVAMLLYNVVQSAKKIDNKR